MKKDKFSIKVSFHSSIKSRLYLFVIAAAPLLWFFYVSRHIYYIASIAINMAMSFIGNSCYIQQVDFLDLQVRFFYHQKNLVETSYNNETADSCDERKKHVFRLICHLDPANIRIPLLWCSNPYFVTAVSPVALLPFAVALCVCSDAFTKEPNRRQHFKREIAFWHHVNT